MKLYKKYRKRVKINRGRLNKFYDKTWILPELIGNVRHLKFAAIKFNNSNWVYLTPKQYKLYNEAWNT